MLKYLGGGGIASAKIGFGNVNIFSDKYNRGAWVNSGTVVFNGKCNIGKGAKICCSKDAKIIFGNNFVNTAKMTVVSTSCVEFQSDVLVSWNVTIMDNDTHKIKKDGERINESKPIKIGMHTWIGCESMILKGVETAPNSVVAAKSLITKSCKTQKCVIGGTNKELHSGIEWEI